MAELQHSYSADVRQGPDTGVWSVTLDPIAAGGPYTITAYADDGSTISITDVLFGDVWVCSGQSNMQFSTDQVHSLVCLCHWWVGWLFGGLVVC